jgi:hypothetical protein
VSRHKDSLNDKQLRCQIFYSTLTYLWMMDWFVDDELEKGKNKMHSIEANCILNMHVQ